MRVTYALRGPSDDGAPDGLFDPRRFGSFRGYLAWVLSVATTDNGVFGFKVMSAYLPSLVAELRELIGPGAPGDDREVLDAVLPGLRYVRLVREDKVAQAVSLWRAIRTWRWRKDEEADGPPGDGLRYSFRALDRLRAGLEAEEAWWDVFFGRSGITPLVLRYEEVAADPPAAVATVLAYAGVAEPPPPAGAGTMRRQADTLSAEWAARYRAEAALPTPEPA